MGPGSAFLRRSERHILLTSDFSLHFTHAWFGLERRTAMLTSERHACMWNLGRHAGGEPPFNLDYNGEASLPQSSNCWWGELFPIKTQWLLRVIVHLEGIEVSDSIFLGWSSYFCVSELVALGVWNWIVGGSHGGGINKLSFMGHSNAFKHFCNVFQHMPWERAFQ